jgi:hypothetical protein
MPLFVTDLTSSWSASVVSVYALPGLLKDALDLFEPVKGRHLLVAGCSLHDGTLSLRS